MLNQSRASHDNKHENNGSDCCNYLYSWVCPWNAVEVLIVLGEMTQIVPVNMS
jgi:hypothetical protein